MNLECTCVKGGGTEKRRMCGWRDHSDFVQFVYQSLILTLQIKVRKVGLHSSFVVGFCFK